MKTLPALFFSLFFISGSYAESGEDYFNEGIEAYDKEEFTEACELFRKACDSGNADGCSNLGVMYKNGQGIKQDYFKAVELYEKACSGGNAKGCFNLGFMYINGYGVKADIEKALNLFGQACEMKEQAGCQAYADLKKNLGQ